MSHKSRPNTKALLASLMLLAAPVLDSAVAQDAKDGPIEDIGKGFKMQRIGEIRNVYYAGKMVAHRSDDATFSTEEWSDGVILRIEDPHGLGGEPVTGFYIFQDGEYLTFDVDVHSAGSSSLPATVTLERKGNLVTEHFSRSDGSKAETIYFERKVIARNDGRVPASNAAGDEPGNVGGQAANPPPAVPAKPKSSIRATDNEQLDRIIQAIEERLARPGDSGDQAADTPPAGTPASPAKSKSSVWATDNEQLDRIIQAIEEKLAQEDAEKPKASGPQGSDQGRTSALDGGSNTAANVQSRTAGNEIKPADVSVLGDVQSGPANPPGGAPNKAALDVNEIVTVLSSPDIGQRGVLAKIEAIRKPWPMRTRRPERRSRLRSRAC